MSKCVTFDSLSGLACQVNILQERCFTIATLFGSRGGARLSIPYRLVTSLNNMAQEDAVLAAAAASGWIIYNQGSENDLDFEGASASHCSCAPLIFEIRVHRLASKVQTVKS